MWSEFEGRIDYTAVTDVDERGRTIIVGYTARRRSGVLVGRGVTKNYAKIDLCCKENEQKKAQSQSNKVVELSTAIPEGLTA